MSLNPYPLILLLILILILLLILLLVLILILILTLILLLILILILMHVSQEGVSKVEIKDLPTVWKERMLDSLGVTVPSDATGPLQDVHWSMGTYRTYST